MTNATLILGLACTWALIEHVGRAIQALRRRAAIRAWGAPIHKRAG